MNPPGKLRLVPFHQRDFDTLIGWIRSARELLEWAGPVFTYPLDAAQLERHCRRRRGSADRRLYTVLDGSTQAAIGHVELCDIHSTHRSARLCRVLIGPRDQRRRGWGALAVRAALAIAFDELRLHRVSLGVFDFNAAAIGCYAKVGFRREGLLRDARRFEDEYWSLLAMSILEDEWRTEPAWSPSFDADKLDGKGRSSAE